jgi:hypothetical protein
VSPRPNFQTRADPGRLGRVEWLRNDGWPRPYDARYDAVPDEVPMAPAEAIAAPSELDGAGAEAAASPESDPSRQVQPGTGTFLNEDIAKRPAPGAGATGEVTFNFEGESLHAVVKAILGDFLSQNYVIAPGVQGTVTFSTAKPLRGDQALSILEMLLRWNNATLVWQDGPLHHLARGAGAAGQSHPAHRPGPERARLRSACHAIAVHLGAGDGKAAEALCQARGA